MAAAAGMVVTEMKTPISALTLALQDRGHPHEPGHHRHHHRSTDWAG